MGLGTIIVICLILGAVTAAIGQKKNLPVGQSFALGALLGIFGAIIVICQRPGLPKAPSGMRAVKCPRCNTIQNVPETQPEYVCWQCKAAHRLWGAAPSGN
jgi:DNA-directed RNA polymerase subunit RPC12/RpoP